VLDPSAHLGSVPVLRAQGLVDLAVPAHALVGEVARLWRLGLDQRLLTGVGAVAVDAALVAMQQLGQRVLVVHVGRAHHGAVRKPRAAVHANVHLHPKVPLRALARLVHLQVARLVGVLGRARRADDGGVHAGAGAQLQAAGPMHLANRREQLLAELALLR